MKKAFLIFSLVLIFFTVKSQNTKYQNLDSLIYSIIEDVSIDSLKNYVTHLKNYGNRHYTNPNRKEVATWIAYKYISWGYNVELDSFKSFTQDSLMQYNVIATKKGFLDSSLIYIIGGHYDTWIDSPGADDNASGTSATLEVARTMSKKQFQPPYTIKFIAFAAEDVLPIYQQGSKHYVDKILEKKENVQFVLINDMISYDPQNKNIVQTSHYDNFDWILTLINYCFNKYTPLKMKVSETNNFNWSDNHRFWEENIASAVLFNADANYNIIHTPADTSSNFNYLTNITKANIPILINAMHFQFLKEPKIECNCNFIKFYWESLSNTSQGYNIYRSTNFDDNYIKINDSIIKGNCYIDSSIVRGIKYFYYISAFEKIFPYDLSSNKYILSTICKDKGILIVDDSEGGLLSPHDTIIDKYYNDLLQGYLVTNIQTEIGQSIDFTKIADYSTIFWHLNYNNYSTSNSALNKSIISLKTYLDNGGQLFLTTYKPDDYSNNNSANKYFSKNYLKIKDGILSSNLRKAIPLNNEYPIIDVDSLKLPFNYNGHLKYVKSLFPTSEADTLLVSSTYYANNTVQGQYNGNPIAIGYFGEDYKTVTLSFPLYYMDFAQSKVFVDKILHEKFHESVGIKEIEQKEKAGFIMQLYPNPCVNDLYVRYNLEKQSNVALEIFNSSGVKVLETNPQTKSSGENYQWLHNLNLPEGLYVLILKTNDFVDSQKFIIKK